MVKKRIFTLSEKRVISAMYQLGRWATAYEISDWADGMSWNTANSVLRRLKLKKIVKSKMLNKKRYWMMNEF